MYIYIYIYICVLSNLQFCYNEEQCKADHVWNPYAVLGLSEDPVPVSYWLFCTVGHGQQSFFLRLSLRTVSLFCYWREEQQESTDHNRTLKLSYFLLIFSRPFPPPPPSPIQTSFKKRILTVIFSVYNVSCYPVTPSTSEPLDQRHLTSVRTGMYQLNFQQHNKFVGTLIFEFNTNYNESVPVAVLIIYKVKQSLLRRIFGPTQKANGEWRLKTNEELEEAINNEYIVRYIKYKRLSWLGHVERMTNERVAKTIYK